MPASFDVHNGLVDVVFAWPDNQIDRAQEVVGGAAKYLHDRGRGPTMVHPDTGETVQVPWEELSNQQQLTILFQESTRNILEMAKIAKVDSDTETARNAAIEYADDNYNLNP